jgi:hypothetical protein
MLIDQQIKSIAIPSMVKLDLNRFLDSAVQSMKEGNESDAIDQLRSGLNLAHRCADNEWVLRFNAYLNLFI